MGGFAQHIREIHRAEKLKRFNAWGPNKQPVLIAEGDSWFEYPFTDDTILALSTQYKVLGLAKAGDTVQDVLTQQELIPAVKKHIPDIVLLSIGGNNIVDALDSYVHTFSLSRPRTGPAYVKPKKFRSALKVLFEQMRPTCQTIVDLGVDIIVSGYDYPNPRAPGEVGAQWLGPTLLKKCKIDDRPLWHAITKHLIDLYEIEMRSFIADMNKGRAFGAQMSFVSGINAVNNGSYDPTFGTINPNWNDEMHPHSDGFQRLANRIADKIEQIVQRRMIPVA